MPKKGGLGCLEPTDWKHVEKFPLTAITRPPDFSMPAVLGINWYDDFDYPEKDTQAADRYWIGRGDLGGIRGRHAICAKAGNITDPETWWRYYNQGNTGRCVGFSVSRMMSQVNRVQYDAGWLYNQATIIDEWPGNENDQMSGTSLRAGLEVLRTQGHVAKGTEQANLSEGILEYRWMARVEEIHAVLKSKKADQLGAIPLNNSWGKTGYPHYVWMPDETVHRLLAEYGEAAVVTDL